MRVHIKGVTTAFLVLSTACTAVEPEEPEHGVATFALRDLDPVEAEFLVIINDYRADHGCGPLTASRSINQAAYDHSYDMGVNRFFDHYSLDGRSPFDRMCEAGHTPACTGGAMMGENIAAGMPDANSAFVAWRGSPGHNANMLTCDFTCIGIGRAVVSGSPMTYYWTTDFSSVIDHPVCDCTGSETRPCTSGPCEGVETCDGCYWGPCDAPAPSDEVCDGIDNDCDGLTDEDGVCDSCEPSAEVCDGIDNDCDGLVDEDGVCDSCEPSAEVCDGIDNDCDGAVDEEGVCGPGDEVPPDWTQYMEGGCSCSVVNSGTDTGARFAALILLVLLLACCRLPTSTSR